MLRTIFYHLTNRLVRSIEGRVVIEQIADPDFCAEVNAEADSRIFQDILEFNPRAVRRQFQRGLVTKEEMDDEVYRHIVLLLTYVNSTIIEED